MRLLAIKICLFLAPFVVYAGVCFVVDPFCYFRGCPNDLAKAGIAKRLNDPMWKLLSSRNAIAPNIYLGSSKVALFNAAVIRQRTGRSFSNFAFGGATLEEQINMFWLIAEKNALESVYFEVDLISYNENNRRDRVSGVKSLLSNPLLYLFNYNVFEGIVDNLRTRSGGSPPKKERSAQEKDAFWSLQLNDSLSRYLDIYSYPKDYEQKLQGISKYARMHDIDVNFVFCPVHEDIPKIAYGEKYDLLPVKNKIISTLKGIGRVVDAEQVNDVTASKDNFSDPFHINSSVINEVYVSRVFGADSELFSDSLVRIYEVEG